MKPQIGKFYNICFEATNEEEVTFRGTAECIGNQENGIYVFLAPNGYIGFFQEEDILSEHAGYKLVGQTIYGRK
jgi:hypothetical protein